MPKRTKAQRRARREGRKLRRMAKKARRMDEEELARQLDEEADHKFMDAEGYPGGDGVHGNPEGWPTSD